VEPLLDGTFVATTYGYWIEGEQPFIVRVRFRLEERGAKIAQGGLRACFKIAFFTSPPALCLPITHNPWMMAGHWLALTRPGFSRPNC
jgi:hypothetical protein